jgi:ribosomal protein L37AE/L43A
MADLFQTTIICDDCNTKTTKKKLLKLGFPIRAWECPSCQKLWEHPSDLQEYQKFKQIKDKTFKVKLRLVGNSYTVSIPREIIEFEEQMQQEINDIIRMALEGPGKLSLFFDKKLRKFY